MAVPGLACKIPLYRGLNLDTIFSELFIFEIANNHGGSVEHGQRLIREFGAIAKEAKINAAIKFQLRDLPTFIHPAHRKDSPAKHVNRFLSTELSLDQFAVLFQEAKKQNLRLACSVFDEKSVDDAISLGVEIFKVASCSAKDVPLLQKIAAARLPTIASTAGLNEIELERLARHFTAHAHFALMHCVAIYPTPDSQLQLQRISFLKQKFPTIKIGYSTHEHPENTSAIQMACALGAELYERHIGIATPDSPLNSYSSSPSQIKEWLHSYSLAKEALRWGNQIDLREQKSLSELKRGIFAKRPLKLGEKITTENSFLAMPMESEQQASADDISDSALFATSDIAENGPVLGQKKIVEHATPSILREMKKDVLQLLRLANIPLGADSIAEFSHHYGLENFYQTGATIFTLVNRAYCKKILVLTAGQAHPTHFHQAKEETFYLLYGDLTVGLDGENISLQPGDSVLIRPGEKHSFTSKNGAVFEEISTEHLDGDSFYLDGSIASQSKQRKTILPLRN